MQLDCFPGQSDLWVPRECLLEMGDGTKFGREDLCVPLEIGAGEKAWKNPLKFPYYSM